MEKCVNDYFIKNDEAYGSDEFQEIYKVEGKCIYEVIRVITGAPLFLKEHMERLENSLSLAETKINISIDTVEKYVKQLISLNKVSCGNMKIVINNSNLFIFCIPAHYPSNKLYVHGVKTILYFGERSNPNAKVINDDFRSKVNKEIEKSNSFEAILVNRDGFITEGSKSNIFIIRGNEVLTAPVGAVLPGITRSKVIEACELLGLKVVEKNVNYNELSNMDGLFISGTSPKVLPIKEIENIIKFENICSVILEIKEKYDKIIEKNLQDYEEI